MAQKKRSSRWRVWHRWLSLVFGVQMVIGGLITATLATLLLLPILYLLVNRKSGDA